MLAVSASSPPVPDRPETALLHPAVNWVRLTGTHVIQAPRELGFCCENKWEDPELLAPGPVKQRVTSENSGCPATFLVAREPRDTGTGGQALTGSSLSALGGYTYRQGDTGKQREECSNEVRALSLKCPVIRSLGWPSDGAENFKGENWSEICLLSLGTIFPASE